MLKASLFLIISHIFVIIESNAFCFFRLSFHYCWGKRCCVSASFVLGGIVGSIKKYQC